MKTHFFMQLNQSSGLRVSKSKFDSSRKLQKEFKMPSVSQLSRMNSIKSVEMFRNLFLHVLSKTASYLNRIKCVSTIMNINIIDSTGLNVGKGLAPDLYYKGELSAISISTELSR